jgi:hypothetical protein
MLKFGQDLRKTHKSTQRKNLGALQFSGIMQFELEFFYILFMTYFTKRNLVQILLTPLAYKKKTVWEVKIR